MPAGMPRAQKTGHRTSQATLGTGLEHPKSDPSHGFISRTEYLIHWLIAAESRTKNDELVLSLELLQMIAKTLLRDQSMPIQCDSTIEAITIALIVQ
jgi:hypothetical protein